MIEGNVRKQMIIHFLWTVMEILKQKTRVRVYQPTTAENQVKHMNITRSLPSKIATCPQRSHQRGHRSVLNSNTT